jgi:hypothetical protein
MNKQVVAQELVKVAKTLLAKSYPAKYFEHSGARNRANTYGLMDVENDELTAVGLIAKLEEMQEADGGVSRFIYNDAQKRLMQMGFRMPPGIRKVASANKKIAGEIPLATNTSTYSWEDFYDDKTATIYLDENTGSLRLVIQEKAENSGMNPYRRSVTLEDITIGTLERPRLGNVASLLKKHGHDRTSAGGPFKNKWKDASGNLAPLSAILQAAASQRSPAPAAPATPAVSTEQVMISKGLLSLVDKATIEVENATEGLQGAVEQGDAGKIKYALGRLDTALATLIKASEDYQKVVRRWA